MKQIAFGILILALTVALVPADAPAKPNEDADDTQDVLYVGQPYPVLIRLHLRIDGQPAQGRWDAYLEKLFKHLDRNNSGGLDRIEASKIPSAQQMVQFFQGNVFIPFNPRVGAGVAQVNFTEVDKDRDGKVTLEELKDYYARNGAAAVQIQVGSAFYAPGIKETTDPVFDLLDTNKDGKLSRAELEAAETVLMKYDNDDNELISQAELGVGNPFAGNFRIAQPQKPAAAAQSNLMLVSRDDGRRAAGKMQIARDVLARYDKDKDGRLSREEIGFPKKLFDQLDRNKDGKLSVLELLRWVKEKPAGEFSIRLGSGGAMMRGRKQAMSGPAAKLGEMNVKLEGVRINVMPQPMAPVYGNTRGLENLFDLLDVDKKGFITRKQIEGQQFASLRGLFELADRNNDGRLTRKEMKDYLGLMSAAQGMQVNLSIASTGQGLFQTLDANGDGQLSVRELRNAWKRLQPLDIDGDGCISRREFPFQFRLTVGQASSAAFQQAQVLAVRGAGRPGMRAPARGPLWFRKMDRNGDGDVSRTEWLGTREQFDAIDTDHDGLISVEEAEAYDARIRK